MKVDVTDNLDGGFNYEFVRGVSTQSAGAAELGECLETMRQVRDNDFDSWIDHWRATADRVASYAEAQLQAGQPGSGLSARLRKAGGGRGG
ncbi:MAG: hypothetical protein JO057_08820, partial [Chloroflexi bacterium]|nr:hypothetical protein [Chloroflexota bacterium]